MLSVIRRGEANALLRQTLSSLIVLDVRKRDALQRFLAVGLSNLDDFEWVAQLRYYWEVRACVCLRLCVYLHACVYECLVALLYFRNRILQPAVVV